MVTAAPETSSREAPTDRLCPPGSEGEHVYSGEWGAFRGTVPRELRPESPGTETEGNAGLGEARAASGSPEALAAGTWAVASSPALSAHNRRGRGHGHGNGVRKGC